MAMTNGSLVVIGTGIKAFAQTTHEAAAYACAADKLLYLVADPLSVHYLKSLKPTAESLFRFYATDKDRSITYEEIVEYTVAYVQQGLNVCLALYGHPSVFAYPGREAVRRVRAMGLEAQILPGVSAQDCLFADLGVDPGSSGCQSFEATDFLLRRRVIDVSTMLILWQVGVVGVMSLPTETCNRRGLELLVTRLVELYGATHDVTVYEAAQQVLSSPVICRTPLNRLVNATITPISTLYVPPLRIAESDPAVLKELTLVPDQIGFSSEVAPSHQAIAEGTLAPISIS
jgi:uncharacterized protein YabN with tetrapyrrole methylase and pyrophosphatase domain